MLLLGTTIGIILFGTHHISETKLLNLGEIPYKFKLENTYGNIINLSNYMGKYVLIIFFTTDCPYCLSQLANLNKIQELFRENIQVIAISESSKQKTINFEKAHALIFPLVIDNERVNKKYKTNVYPTIYILDRDQKIIYKRLGLRSLSFDLNIISNLIKTNKLPIEFYGDGLIDQNFPLNTEKDLLEIALDDPEARLFFEETLTLKDTRRAIISIYYPSNHEGYKHIIKFLQVPCDCPGNKETFSLFKVEIDQKRGKIIDKELIRNVPKDTLKNILFKEILETGLSLK